MQGNQMYIINIDCLLIEFVKILWKCNGDSRRKHCEMFDQTLSSNWTTLSKLPESTHREELSWVHCQGVRDGIYPVTLQKIPQIMIKIVCIPLITVGSEIRT